MYKRQVAILLNAAIHYKRTSKRRFALWTQKSLAHLSQPCEKKNMTQMDLARKLQVTDKAVSKWERGLGFPDINTIEPLADAWG